MAEPLINCRQHTTEILNLFCCKCEEVICVHCMVDSHQMHGMKHLFDVKKVIQGQLSRFLTSEHEKITGKIKGVKDFVLKELSDSDTDEKKICKRIEKLAESEKNKIESHTKDLTDNLQTKYATYRQTVQAVVETVTDTETRITDLRKSGNDIDNIEWTEQVELYSNIKKSVNILSTIEKYKKDMKPRFVPTNDINDRKITVGFIEIGGNNETSNGVSKFISPGIYSDLNTKSPTRNQTNTSRTPDESSSDEIRSEYPLTIELSSSVKKCVSKIIPISEEDAWIICENKLFKLRGCKLEETLYAERVDDMTVLGDGSVILLNRQEKFIKRLLGKRILNFSNYGSNHPICLKATPDDYVIVLVDSSYCMSEIQLDVVQLDNLGIVKSRFSFPYAKSCRPMEITVRNNSDLYIIINEYSPLRSTIVRIDLKTKKLDIYNKFSGAIGMNPSAHFICHGLCIEPNNKVLVSDQNHHIVFLIDNMKFVKSVFVAENGLDSPGTLAFFNGILWIADGTKIHKFKYK
ncbi:unnamed protein product [Mytilus coruscus]|uniref:B box-type domain-containing protein n=1 Tax=Mytilus coruscus TaxID=42192 RepID=A0A6J8ERA5_MYTCO|nr:unnamed protein product [Mytilus coruscus]